MSEEDVTLWIQQLKQGDELAAEDLWNQYFVRLVGLGRRLMRNSVKRENDEEDVALSAFKSLCIRARDDRFPRLHDRDDLWKLLVTIVARKAFRSNRKSNRQSSENEFIEQEFASGEPSPDFAAQMDDTIEGMLARLNDEALKEIAAGKLEGLTNQEIANKLNRSISFVERKLQLIRQIWSSEVNPD